MAAKTTARKTATKKDEPKVNETGNELPILDQTNKEKTKTVSRSKSGAVVYIACGLQNGIKFKLTTNSGAVKEIEFPGVNSALKGKSQGILAPEGNAVLTSVSREDWEQIQKEFGSAPYMTCEPPLLMEVKTPQEFNDRDDEIKEMKTGLEPIDPKQVNVEQATKED